MLEIQVLAWDCNKNVWFSETLHLGEMIMAYTLKFW
jgi:hypothetical protein